MGTEHRAVGAPIEQTASLRYGFLDGLRGVAALTIMVFHMIQPFGLEKELPSPWIVPSLLQHIVRALRVGRSAVVVFIVLSGFCLMLPVVRSPELQLRGGFWDYWRRRARRILPAYFGALALSVAFYKLVWWAPIPVKSLIAHALLIHDLSAAWCFDLNPPMWTVAVEWQIYAFFPLLLLPTWRRWGWKGTTLVALGVGLAPVLLLPAGYDLSWACPWFLGLFAFGMAAAAAEPYRWPWARIGLAALVGGVVIIELARNPIVVDDIVVGGGTACLLIACVRWTEEAASGHGRVSRPLVLRVLESRFAMWVGKFSYSLYLTHILVKWWLLDVVRRMAPSIPKGMAVLLGGGIVLAITVSYLFHRLVERPFMSGAGRLPAAPQALGGLFPQ